MSDRIKKIKIKQTDGTFSDYIPIGANAKDIDLQYNGSNVESTLKKKPYYYDSVAEMKLDDTLKEGDMAITLGYYEANDGGGAEYEIGNFSEEDDALSYEGGMIHTLVSNLKAKIIIHDGKINVDQFGAKGDGITDDTEAIQKAIDSASIIFFSPKTYMIDSVDESIINDNIHKQPLYNGGISLSSNKRIEGNNATLKCITNDSSSYNIFRLCQVDNIIIENIKFDGDRDTHTASDGEWGHDLMILNSSNINIENCEFNNAWGDGIYVGVLYNSSITKETNNVTIKNCKLDNNSRNALSICSCDKITVENNIFSNTTRVNPKTGIDIESEGVNPKLKNIYINNNIFDSNSFGIDLFFNSTNIDFNKVEVNNNTFLNGATGLNIFTSNINKKLKGNIIIDNNSFIDQGWTAFSIQDFLSDYFDTMKISNTYILNCNNTNKNIDNNSVGWINGSGLVIYKTHNDEYDNGNIIITNLDVVDTRETKLINKAICSVNQTSSGKMKNIYLINPLNLDCLYDQYLVMQGILIEDKNSIINYNDTYFQNEISSSNIMPVTYSSGSQDNLRSTILNDDNDKIANNTKIKFINDSNKNMQIKCGNSSLINVYNLGDISQRYIRCTTTDIGAFIELQKINGKWIVINKQGEWTRSNSSF